MYSEADIEAAVAAGAMPAEAAAALRAYVAESRVAPAVDEEHFRLLTGFNDIFVSIAIVLLLVALAWIGGSVSAPLGGAAVALGAWALAEYFTRARRMALPSILLLLAFVGGVAGSLVGFTIEADPNWSERTSALVDSGIAAVAAGAAWLHWRRFHVPITVAAGAVALVGRMLMLVLGGLDAADRLFLPLLLLGGLALFAFAMRWDMSDRTRTTRRSDVAFWLHLAAAPMIAHALFQSIGVMGGRVSVGGALLVLALYALFALVALAVDRRALLVSSLIYVLYALSQLFEHSGVIGLSVALTALLIGSALLTLSAFWHPIRRAIVARLPDRTQGLLPVIDCPAMAGA